jgi:mRNA deadenylase 3'-5' endonuclease subunit Ccr4
LISGYNYTDPSKEDYLEMTTFKIRDKEYYRIIDYIFYSNFVNKIKVTPTMKKDEFKLYEKDITSTGLPSSFFPSDHYYLNLVFNI